MRKQSLVRGIKRPIFFDYQILFLYRKENQSDLNWPLPRAWQQVSSELFPLWNQFNKNILYFAYQNFFSQQVFPLFLEKTFNSKWRTTFGRCEPKAMFRESESPNEFPKIISESERHNLSLLTRPFTPFQKPVANVTHPSLPGLITLYRCDLILNIGLPDVQ